MKNFLILNCTYDEAMRWARLFCIYIGIVAFIVPFMFIRDLGCCDTDETLSIAMHSIQGFTFFAVAILQNFWLRVWVIAYWLCDSIWTNWFPAIFGGLEFHSVQSIFLNSLLFS